MGVTPAQVAIAWLLAQGEDIAPVPGAKRVPLVEENAAADAVVLAEGQLVLLGAVRPPVGDRYEDMTAING